MRTPFICLLLLLVMAFPCVGQQTTGGFPLQCEGEIPEDVLQRTSLKVEADINEDRKTKTTMANRRAKEDFLVESNYLLDQLLSGGNILFGDSVTTYVNKVASRLIEADTELEEGELRFYTVLSNVPNAFSTHQGMIFITTGLISRFENEAQLAFVLAHEIEHYKRKHVINRVVEIVDLKLNNARQQQKGDVDKAIEQLSEYSVNIELEADEGGLDLLVKAGYSPEAALQVFSILVQSDQVLWNTPLSTTYLNTYKFALPYGIFEYTDPALENDNSYEKEVVVTFTEETDEKRTNKEEPLELQTHPDIAERIAKTTEQIAAKNYAGGAWNQVSTTSFNTAVHLTQLETVHLALNQREYAAALYLALYMLEEEPNNLFLQEAVFKALYGATSYAADNKYYSVSKGMYTKGQVAGMHHFFEEGDKTLLLALTLNQGWKMYQKTRKELHKDRLENLLELYFKKNLLDESTLLNLQFDADSLNNGAHAFTLLNGLENWEAFVTLVKEADEASLASTKSIKPLNGAVNDDIGQGANKVVLLNPSYMKADSRKGIKRENAETELYKLYTYIEEASEPAQVEVDLIAPKSMSESEVTAYNDLAVINQWIEEVYQHSDDLNYLMIPSAADEAQEVASAHNTPFFMQSYVLSYKYNQRKALLYGVYAFLLPPAIPLMLYFGLKPYYQTFYLNMLVNIDEHCIANTTYYFLQLNPSSGDMKSLTYDYLTRIKQAP